MNSEPKLNADPKTWRLLASEARRMRSAPTEAENMLWQSLRLKLTGGLKFRRQHAIDRFIVDFYCVKAHLVMRSMDNHDGQLELTGRAKHT